MKISVPTSEWRPPRWWKYTLGLHLQDLGSSHGHLPHEEAGVSDHWRHSGQVLLQET